jgi:DNA-binding response OmpR family regulator
MQNAIVILQNDPARAENLVSQVRSVSEAVFIVRSLVELQRLASQFPIQVGVLDLGLVTFQEIIRLRHQLGIEIVCMHHTPDESMWTEALDAGALDCCFDDDGPAICRAILQTSTFWNRTAS